MLKKRARTGVNFYLTLSLSNSFYVGDSAGRNNDAGDADIKFALNIGIKYYTPDEYYDNCKIKITNPTHPLDMVKTDKNPIDYSCFKRRSIKMIKTKLSGLSMTSN